MEYRYIEEVTGVCPISQEEKTIDVEFLELPDSHFIGRKAMVHYCPDRYQCPKSNECPIYLAFS